jgi:hypothetical protein
LPVDDLGKIDSRKLVDFPMKVAGGRETVRVTVHRGVPIQDVPQATFWYLTDSSDSPPSYF